MTPKNCECEEGIDLISFVRVSVCSLFVILLLASCSPKKPKVEWEEVPKIQPSQVEVLSPVDQAAEEIAKTPTKFALQYPAAQISWDRARLFFEQYTTNSTYVAAGRGAVRLNNRASPKDPTIFEVERRDIPAGIEFTLHCTSRSGKNPEQSCRNLARFMREGTWEGNIY